MPDPDAKLNRDLLTSRSTEAGGRAGFCRRFAPPSAPAMTDGTERAVERATHDRFVDLFVRVRIYAAPVVALLAALAAFEGPLWRSASLLTVSIGMLALALFEHRQYRRREELAFGFRGNLGALMVAQALVITGTGGLLSPLMPGVLLFGVIGGLFGPVRFVRWVPVLFHLPWLALLAWLHVAAPLEGFIPFYLEGWVVLGEGAAPWIVAGIYGLFVLGSPRAGRGLRRVITRAYGDLSAARDRELELHRSQRSELESLTGELARDLEAPLASMVDLGARLERELDEGAPARARNHTRSLRTEVDRMRAVIAELVDFARPVSPLALKEHDLEALLHELVLLYERTCAERALTMQLRSRGQTVAPIDKRKIRTAVMNLIQNAVEASPAGGTIAIELEGRRHEVRITIRDVGPGLIRTWRSTPWSPG
jgi:signal transduction histidine kinase